METNEPAKRVEFDMFDYCQDCQYYGKSKVVPKPECYTADANKGCSNFDLSLGKVFEYMSSKDVIW